MCQEEISDENVDCFSPNVAVRGNLGGECKRKLFPWVMSLDTSLHPEVCANGVNQTLEHPRCISVFDDVAYLFGPSSDRVRTSVVIPTSSH